ncbi:hypothetical protein LSAT2_028289 [Lamellibrachia satsuma]|nr:hypothetical protein LSAT2_028289 [Lamellibrachia satsuma]
MATKQLALKAYNTRMEGVKVRGRQRKTCIAGDKETLKKYDIRPIRAFQLAADRQLHLPATPPVPKAVVFDIPNEDAEKVDIIKKHPPKRLQRLEPLESAPHMTAEMLEQKQRNAEQKRLQPFINKTAVILLQGTHWETTTNLKIPGFALAGHIASKHHGMATFVKTDALVHYIPFTRRR